jgi:hypothetical protein
MRVLGRIAAEHCIDACSRGLLQRYQNARTSASASIYGPQISGGSLSQQEVARLSSWMKAHDAGWRVLMETSPAPITMAIVMREPDGRQSSLDVFESKDGAAMVYFNAPSPAAPLQRYLLEADVLTLRAAVGK